MSISAEPHPHPPREFEPVEFDVCGPLPTGVTVLEASAGTGKTYTIAALAARYVAQGIPLERMLLVTFTRMATGELRERVRERLVAVERGLRAALAGGAPDQDPVVALLASGDAALARDRLARAIAGFDSATIATTHGFCQEVLGGLGIAGDLEPDVAFVEDLSDLVSEVVDDLYIRRFARGSPATFSISEAIEIARVAIENPSAEIVGGEDEVAQMRARLALAARHELEARKRAMAVMTYDDLVTRLGAALQGPGSEATASVLRGRFDVVLVDEFQDTDPAQWEIMQRAFGQGGATLVLIADPKQAIYAFRGADVYAYLEAAGAADSRATLQVNWRSDQGLIDAHDALFAGARLGHEGIAYRQVRAAPEHQTSALADAPIPAPLRFRVAMRESPSLALTQYGYAQKASASELIARDLAGDVVALLSSDATIDTKGVCPADLAVLVRTNRQAALIREALGQSGVPAVINGAGSVFGTEIAREWLALLESLERPASITRAHAAALTCFIGWSADRLAEAGDDEDSWEWEDVHRRLHDWARILRARGVASLLETISLTQDLPARMLADADGERRLTDVRHIGQLLHEAASAEQLGPTALTGWLRTRIAEVAGDAADEERSRRLESDAQAVQVLTIHRSKGLEFPIVYLPFLWEGWTPRDARPVFFHDPAAGDARRIDVALQGSEYRAHRDQFVREQRGEELRLAYVALTRARHQAIVWWAGSWDSRHSPLGRLLFSRDAAGDVASEGSSTPDDAAVLARLSKLAERAPGCITVERAGAAGPAHWSPPLPSTGELVASRFERGLDLRWRRTSYTDITAASHDAWVASEPEHPLISDEPEEDEISSIAPEVAPQLSVPAPLATMPVGATIGTFVHRVMEATDFAAPDLEAELTGRIAEVQGGRGLDIGDPAAVVEGLRAAIETPLGPVLGGIALREVARSDRLDELGFELPLAGGDQPAGWLSLDRIAAVLRDHMTDGDPLSGYAQRLADPALRQTMRGYLTGSLDLVVRLRGSGGEPERFAVLDYKTNWLGEPDEPLTAFHYRHEAIAAEMSRHHYALQALLYTVALHRYLRWRVPGYEPDRQLAGVAYLFVRGMTGRDGSSDPGTTAQAAPYGVFGWRPPLGLAQALSDALDAGAGS
ncbi:MAG: UvrD-helicase domain-containing protein [Solirubrobacteraceae bacterium]